jgi:hypothetical protein
MVQPGIAMPVRGVMAKAFAHTTAMNRGGPCVQRRGATSRGREATKNASRAPLVALHARGSNGCFRAW